MPKEVFSDKILWLAQRHGKSRFNVFQDMLSHDPDYQLLNAEYERNPRGAKTRAAALKVYMKFRGQMILPDHAIPLCEAGVAQAEETGRQLSKLMEVPHRVILSAQLRSIQTYEGMSRTWPALREIPVSFEPLLNEQNHGLVNQFVNWRVFLAMHPAEHERKMQNEHDYRYPEGESINDMFKRIDEVLQEAGPKVAKKRTLWEMSQFSITALRCLLTGTRTREFDWINQQDKLENAALGVFEPKPSGTEAELVNWNVKFY